MCHHYRLQAELRGLEREVSAQLAQAHAESAFPLGDFYPLSHVPVVRLNHPGQRELVPVQWGLLPHWWKPLNRNGSRKAFQRKCFNARCETLYEKPSYREAYKHRRCLIPATEFMEKDHFFHFSDKRTFMLAGLWERWRDDSETVESCTIVTTTPNVAVQAVGHHRMPVVLDSEEKCDFWLSPDAVDRGGLEEIFLPVGSSVLDSYRAT